MLAYNQHAEHLFAYKQDISKVQSKEKEAVVCSIVCKYVAASSSLNTHHLDLKSRNHSSTSFVFLQLQSDNILAEMELLYFGSDKRRET